MGDFSLALKPIPTFPEIWAPRQSPLSMEEVRTCPCKPGKLRRPATVSRTDICTRLAQVSARVNSPQGRDINRIDDLIEIATEWRPATILQHASGSNSGEHILGNADWELRNSGGKVPHGATTLAEWSYAVYGDRTNKGRCRRGKGIGPVSTPRAPCRAAQWSSTFTRELVKSSLSGGAGAFSEMLDRMTSSREFCPPFPDS